MVDHHKEIEDALDRLVREGSVIYLGVEIRSRAPEERKEIEDSLRDVERSAKKEATSKPAGESTVTDVPALKLIQSEDFRGSYQPWYSQALRVVEQLLPDRYEEFRELYRLEKPPKTLDVTTYTISDYIHGTVVPQERIDISSARSIAVSKMRNQVDILSSAQPRLDSLLSDIEGTLETTMLDDELETASELVRAKHLRSAGVIAGVVLERHLKSVVSNHQISLGRKKGQIGNLNDALKQAGLLDTPRWREIQRLGDIRNLCGHDDERKPSAKEVQELIEGTEKIVKTLF